MSKFVLTELLFLLEQPSLDTSNPCQPSPCGPSSQCREINHHAVCSCLPNYIGRPPSCRPECTSNYECSLALACIKEKCSDPCPGSCGAYASCSVVNHSPVCQCLPQYTGDPFSGCHPVPRKSSFFFFRNFTPNPHLNLDSL